MTDEFRGPRSAFREEDARQASMMDLGAYRTALLTLLDRIATALERANDNDPIDAINRALAAGSPSGATPPATGDGREASPPVPPPPTEDGSPLLTTRELASLLNIGRTTAWTLVAQGRIPSVRIGRSLRVTRRDVERFIAARGDADAAPPDVAPMRRHTLPPAEGWRLR